MTLPTFAKTRRPIAALSSLLVGGQAIAHPGHGAPSLHQHVAELPLVAQLGLLALSAAILALISRRLLRRRGQHEGH